jgi:hypothetical protein
VLGSVLSRIGRHGKRESSPERGRAKPAFFSGGRSEREGERRRSTVAGVREMVREREKGRAREREREGVGKCERKEEREKGSMRLGG